MGLWDWMTGSKPARPGVRRVPAAALRKAIMAVNRPTAPFKVRDGKKEGVDLVAEWRIVDAKWYEIFAKSGIKRVFKVMMKFDEDSGTVRATDQEWSIEWRAGVPVLSEETLAAKGSAFRGQSWELSYESVWAFREEDLMFDKVYEYKFDTREIKTPLIEAVLAAGWGWRGVAFGKL